MANACASCGAKLGFGQRLAGKTLCDDCDARQRQAIAEEQARQRQLAAEAMSRYGNAALDAMRDPSSASAAQLPALAAATGLDANGLAQVRSSVIAQRADEVLADDYLSPEEEEAFAGGMQALGIARADWATVLGPNLSRLLIASFNAGRLAGLDECSIVLKKGEAAYFERPAQLMKEVVHREIRGGSTGISIPITKGVRVRTGSFRGHSVVTGTSLEVADEGRLTVTSQRVVFSGSRKSIESVLAKIVSIQAYTDGVRISVSNRQNAALFKVDDGPLVTAAINAALQKIE